jgi:hypothetical protein
MRRPDRGLDRSAVDARRIAAIVASTLPATPHSAKQAQFSGRRAQDQRPVGSRRIQEAATALDMTQPTNKIIDYACHTQSHQASTWLPLVLVVVALEASIAPIYGRPPRVGCSVDSLSRAADQGDRAHSCVREEQGRRHAKVSANAVCCDWFFIAS